MDDELRTKIHEQTNFLPKGQKSSLQIFEKLLQSCCLIIIDTQTESEIVKNLMV